MLVFIPAAALCVLPSELLRWLVVIGACAFSSCVLVGNLRGKFKDHMPHGSTADMLMGSLIFIHILVSLSFKVYFFEFAT